MVCSTKPSNLYCEIKLAAFEELEPVKKIDFDRSFSKINLAVRLQKMQSSSKINMWEMFAIKMDFLHQCL